MKFYSKMLKKIIIPIGDNIQNTNIMQMYLQIEKMQYWSSTKITEWQNMQLKKLLIHAGSNTIYYKKLFEENKINPNSKNSKEELKKIPVLTKDIIRKNYKKLIPKNIQKIPHISSSTGGSTGIPLKFLLDNNSWSFSNANNIFNWEKANYSFGDKYIALGSTSLNVVKTKSFKHFVFYKLKNKIGLNGINMSDEICNIYVELIIKNRIKYIYGYASAIFLLARYVKNNQIKLNITNCFPTSEILTMLYRETIINAFNCHIVNCYGANDGGITAFEHKLGFFNVGYNSIVTLKDEENNKGSALLTDILNYAMPLINYQIEDQLEIDHSKNINYPYNGQIINHIFGRTSDVIKLENGRLLTGPGFTVLFKDIPVASYQIGKIGKNSIRCLIKKLPEYNRKHEDLIIMTLKKQAGEESNIIIEYINNFALTKSGKRRYFIAK